MENKNIITGRTKLLSLIGTPVGHSKSPALQNGLCEYCKEDYAYLAFDVTLENLETAINGLKSMGFKGCNVTMPLKSAIIDYIDELSIASKLSGAVNTVNNVDGKLYGYTTDGVGCVKAFQHAGCEPKGKKLTIVGAGGAATAVIVQFAIHGVKEISVFNIKDSFWDSISSKCDDIMKETGCVINLYDLADHDELRKQISDSDMFINGTPIGMGKTAGQSVIPDASFFESKPVVLDMIYNPEVTKTMELAKSKGCVTISGKNMLVFQGIESFKIWTGKEVPLEVALPYMD